LEVRKFTREKPHIDAAELKKYWLDVIASLAVQQHCYKQLARNVFAAVARNVWWPNLQ